MGMWAEAPRAEVGVIWLQGALPEASTGQGTTIAETGRGGNQL